MAKNLFTHLKFIFLLLITTTLLAAAPAHVSAAPQYELTNIEDGPPITLTYSFQDSGSGLSSIRTVNSENTNVDIPPFAPGINGLVYVTVTQVNHDQSISVSLEAKAMDGSRTICDYTNEPPPGDTTPPNFVIEDTQAGPPASIFINIQDTVSGLRQLRVTDSSNAQISMPSFTTGTTQAVTLSASQGSGGTGFSFALEATDMAGNTGIYQYNHNQNDPSPPTWTIVSEEPGPPYTVKIDIQDGQSGLKDISIVDSMNARIVIPDFVPGVTSPALTVTATRESGNDDFAFALKLEDMEGNKTELVYSLPIEDPNPPICSLTSLQGGPPASFQISVQDKESGLSSLTVVDVFNTTYSIPTFSQGSREPVLISVNQIEANLDYQIRIEAVDMNGNRATADYPDSFQLRSAPEFDAVGNDYLNHFENIYKEGVIEQSRNSNGTRINLYSDFIGEGFFSNAGVAMTDPCFSSNGAYQSILTSPWTEAVYTWEITLQKKPISDLGLHIAGCALRPGEENVWQAASQSGNFRLPTSPEVVRFIPSANPTITVSALPGPEATSNFPAAGYNLDIRSSSSLGRGPAVDVPFISRSLHEETLTLACPNNGEVNATGQTMYALSAGDRIRVTLKIPFNNTTDLRFGRDNVWVFYNGVVGTERTTSN